MQKIRVDRLALPLQLERREALDDRAGRQPLVRPVADHDRVDARDALEPGGEVDGVADEPVLAVAALRADHRGDHLAAVHADAEARPLGPVGGDLGRLALEGERRARGEQRHGPAGRRSC